MDNDTSDLSQPLLFNDHSIHHDENNALIPMIERQRQHSQQQQRQLGTNSNRNNTISSRNANNNNEQDDEYYIRNYMSLVYRVRYVSLVFILLVICPYGILIAFPKFQKMTDSTYQPIDGSLSDMARTAFYNSYHTTASTNKSKNYIDWNDPMNPPLVILLEDFHQKNIDIQQQPEVYEYDEDIHTEQQRNELFVSSLSPMTNNPNSLSYMAAKNFSFGLLPYLMNEQYNCWTWPGDDDYDKNTKNGTDPNATTRSSLLSSSLLSPNNSTNHKNCSQHEWIHVTSYYTLVDEGLQYIADSTMKSSTGDTALVIVQYTFPSPTEGSKSIKGLNHKERIVQLMYAIDNYKNYFYHTYYNTSSTNQTDNTSVINVTLSNSSSSKTSSSKTSATSSNYDFTIRYTGIKYFASDLMLSTLHDLKRMDIIVIPIALLLIGIVLPSSNPMYIWIIPVIAIITTVSLWSIIMYCIASYYQYASATNSSSVPIHQISTFTPTVMMSLSLGMGIDYTLFLLARYLEERCLLENTKDMAIRNMLLGSGHVLILSGITLAATFLGFLLLPLPMLQSIGLGASIAIISSLIVNLTIVPTLLYTFIGDKIIAKNKLISLLGSSSPSSHNSTEEQQNDSITTTSSNNKNTNTIISTDSNGNVNISNGEYGHTRTRSGTTTVRFLLNDDSTATTSTSTATTNQSTTTNPTMTVETDGRGGTGDDDNEYHATGCLLPMNGSMDNEDNDEDLTANPLQSILRSTTLSSSSSSFPSPATNANNMLMKRSMWHRLSKHLLHPYKGIIILLLILQLLSPVAEHALKLKSSLSFDLMLPSKSPSLIAYHELEQKLNSGGGRMNPYRILFDGHPTNTTMTSEVGFNIMHFVINALRMIDYNINDDDSATFTSETISAPTADTISNNTIDREIEILSNTILKYQNVDMQNNPVAYIDCNQNGNDIHNMTSNRTHKLCSTKQHRRRKPTVYNGISVMRNTLIPYSVYISAKICGHVQPTCPVELLRVLDVIDRSTTSHDWMATYVTATITNVSPFSDEGIAWLIAARKVIKQLEDSNSLQGVRVYIEGTAGIAHDAVTAVYDSFPTMMVLTCLIVFGLMGLFFKSVFPPLRSIISITLTLSFAFGLTVMVFQDGLFLKKSAWLVSSSSGGNEICWLVPIMAFSIIVGLALDYDVFLISRILEYRMQSYEHKTSIAFGLHSTGSIISAAGLIMAVSFGSLMFSSNPVLYQWSFLLTVAVLFDTLVVRTIVVPVLTNLAGPKYCWWPRKFSESNQICLAEYQPLLDQSDVAGLLRTLEETSEYESLRRSGP